MSYQTHLLTALSRLINVMFFLGHSNEMLSSRAYRLRANKFWGGMRKAIDILFWFEPNHCQESYVWELALTTNKHHARSRRTCRTIK